MPIIVAAHELGHAILHKDINIACSSSDTANWVKNKLEEEANLFGICLLAMDLQDTPSAKTSGFFFFPDDSNEEYVA